MKDKKENRSLKKNKRLSRKGRPSRSRHKTPKRKSSKGPKEPKNQKKRTLAKNTKQKGGGLLAAIGIGLAATAVTAAAYKGYRLISKVKDTGYIRRLLNQDYVSYAPKVIVTETPDFINHYLECISTIEFFQFVLSNPEYLKSKTLQVGYKQILLRIPSH